MRRVSRSALVPYSAEEMFALVEDVEAYPEFLPWCNEVEVHSRDGDVVDVTLELSSVGHSNDYPAVGDFSNLGKTAARLPWNLSLNSTVACWT